MPGTQARGTSEQIYQRGFLAHLTDGGRFFSVVGILQWFQGYCV